MGFRETDANLVLFSFLVCSIITSTDVAFPVYSGLVLFVGNLLFE